MIITRRLKTIVLLSVIAMIMHGIEEIHQGFYATYTLFARVSHMFSTKSEALFMGYQVTWWVALALIFALVLSETWRFRILLVYGLVLVYENQHIYHAILERKYYPGVLSSLVILPLSIAFWWEVYLQYRAMNKKSNGREEIPASE
jgi:hypothetical protein